MKQLDEFSYFKNRCSSKLNLIFFWILILLGSYQFAHAQVSSYTFAQSSDTFTPITGTILGTATGNTSATNLNSVVYPVAIPFSFNFNGKSYTSLYVSTNGFISFGPAAPAPTSVSPISSQVIGDGTISVWGKDLSSFFDVNGVSGRISWEIIGTAPNREVVIQWKNFRTNVATAVTNLYSFSFQIRLQESSNIIKMVYDAGSYLVGNTAIVGNAQIGLRGVDTSDFNNRLNATSVAFLNSTMGTANSSTQAFNTLDNVPGMPSTGLTYTWTPPSCYAPLSVSTSNPTVNSIDLSWVASPSAPSGGYDIYYNTFGTPPTSATTPNISGFQGTSTTLFGLPSLTSHYVWVRANCGAGNVSVWTSQIVKFSTLCQPPSILTTAGATVCQNQTATLSATADAGATINWYDAQNGGNLLTTGSSYTTQPLPATTNYYVSASSGTTGLSVGKTTFTPNPSSGSGTTNFGLVFDALSFFILDTVTIYPVSETGSNGTLTIDVIDGSGTVVHSKTINVTGSPISSPVAQVINLNFAISPGTNYKLRPGSFTGISGLLFDPSANAIGGNFGYPFVLQNLVSINTSTLTAAPTNTPKNDLYYYFYDWQVSTKCESVRTMVTAAVDTACLSTSEIDKKNNIQLYPNPFSDFININKPDLVKSIQITDLSGKLVRDNMKAEAVIRLNDLASGIYIMLLHMKDGSRQTNKIIKK